MTNGSLTVGDVGIALVIDAGGFNLSGCHVHAARCAGKHAEHARRADAPFAVPIAADGFHAVYTTTGEDFLTGGPWQLQLEVVTPAGDVFTSPPGSIYINPLLQTSERGSRVANIDNQRHHGERSGIRAFAVGE